MASSSGRRLQDLFVTFCSLGAVVAGMAAIDETCRRYILGAVHGEFPAILPGLRLHSLASHAADILPVGNTSFIAFGIAGFVLVVVVFRM